MSIFYLRPKYFFGEKAINESKTDLLNKHYQKALILYGGGSIKKNGSYNDLVSLLNEINLPYVEFSGIEANPKSSTVNKAIEFARINNVDVIFAIGGGSVIDTAKLVGILKSNLNYTNVLDYFADNSKAFNPSIDLVSIITLAGTASENNAGSSITDDNTNAKLAVQTPSAIPVIAIEDPTYTYTVSRWQTASGIFDCFSHLFEQYLGANTFGWTRNYLIAGAKTLIKFAKTAVDNPNDYLARSNILWTTSMALNQLAKFESDADWAVHTIELAFSGRWDITHGAGLAFVTPTYLKLRANKEKWFQDKVTYFGKQVFNASSFEQTIEKIEEFIASIYLPNKWSDFKEIKEITNDDVTFLVNHCVDYNIAPHIDRTFYNEVINELIKLK